MSVIIGNGLAHRFGAEMALEGVDLVLDSGEHIAVLGDNGAGKTTLLRILATALRPTAGRLSIAGLDAVRARRRRGRAAAERHERQDRGPGDPRPCAREQALPAQPGIASRPFGGDRDATARRTMNPFRVALAVARKDLRSEWRTRELVPALAQFIILALLIGNFGFQIDSRSAPSIAP